MKTHIATPTLSRPLPPSNAGAAGKLKLGPGPVWRAPEQLRQNMTENLLGIAPGAVATLNIKRETFRIMRDADFQHLYGLANEVHRIRGGMEVILAAVQVVQEHPTETSIHMLKVAVMSLGQVSLPVRTPSEQFAYQELPDEDDNDLDLSAIKRPLE